MEVPVRNLTLTLVVLAFLSTDAFAGGKKKKDMGVENPTTATAPTAPAAPAAPAAPTPVAAEAPAAPAAPAAPDCSALEGDAKTQCEAAAAAVEPKGSKTMTKSEDGKLEMVEEE
jgi:hypothetical protein